MDPLSVSASIITLLAAAGGSCKFVYNSIFDIADAPAEVQSYRSRLECLERTFSTLLQIYSTLPQDIQVDTVLQNRLVEFGKEIQAMKRSIGAKDNLVRLSYGHRMRERCKWLLHDRQLQKFLCSLEQWDLVFSQAIASIHM